MAEPLTLAALWHRHKDEVPSYPQLIKLAEANAIPGVVPNGNGYGFVVEEDRNIVLTALRKKRGETHGQN